MGTKVNIFVAACLVGGATFTNFNMASLFLVLSGFTALYKDFKVWQFTKKFPGRFSLQLQTFFGNSASNFYRDLNAKWVEYSRDKFITWIGIERFITLSKLQDVQAIFNVTDDAPLMKNYQQMWPWLGGDNIKENASKTLVNALLGGPFHKLTQSESFKKALLNRLEAMSHLSTVGDETFDIQPLVRSLTFDIVCEIALGGAQEINRRKTFEVAENLCLLSDQLIYSGWRPNVWLANIFGRKSKAAMHRDILTQCVKNALSEKRAEGTRKVDCLMDVLMSCEGINDDDIASALVAFLVLGYDRLSSTVCFSMAELAKQGQVQDKILQEMADPSSRPTKVLNNFLLETQRLYPSVIAKWITEGVPLNGFFVPPNSSLLLYLHGTGRDDSRFNRPDKFDFNRTNLSETFGPNLHEHNLPMTIMKAVLGHLLQKYQWKADSGNTEIGCGLTLRPGSVRVHAKSR